MGAGSDCYNEYTAFHLFEEYLEVCCTFKYHAWENFGGKKLVNFVNCELFAKIFVISIHRYTENVFDIFADCSL